MCGSAPSGSHPRPAPPGTRTPSAQTLYVTEGKGLVQPRGGAVEEIRAGDVVYTAPDEWHWHGAAPDHFMTHLSITEAVGDDERPEANWGDHVTDDEYRNLTRPTGPSTSAADGAGYVGTPIRVSSVTCWTTARMSPPVAWWTAS